MESIKQETLQILQKRLPEYMVYKINEIPNEDYLNENLNYTESLNQIYQYYIQSYNDINITELDIAGKTYKPYDVQYFKCKCFNLYGDILKNEIYNEKFQSEHCLPLLLVKLSINFDLFNEYPWVQFNRNLLSPNNVKFSVEWQIQTQSIIPLNSHLGRFYIKYKENNEKEYVEDLHYLNNSINKNNFNYILINQLMMYYTNSNFTNFKLGFQFNTSYVFNIIFNNLMIENYET